MNIVEGKISVVMPGYNEGNRICANLVETERAMSNLTDDFEIIFVNDGSKDKTCTEALKAAGALERVKVVDCPENHGKGNALKIGVERCTGDYIVFLDSDLDLHPAQLDKFFSIMEKTKADVVIGSKLHPASVSNYPKRRKIISFGYYVFLMLLFRLPTKDTQTGMKLFKAHVIKPVMQRILVKRFAFDIEVLANINRLKYKIAEAPIELSYNREMKWGRIKLKDIKDVVTDTLAIFYRMYILHYYDDLSSYTAPQAETNQITKAG